MRLFILKPDGIGDFVLATGALRLLAAEFGEQNLLICVRSLLVPFARSQFPQAEVIDLPTASERKMVNLFTRNCFYCLPLWFKLRRTPVDLAMCFRSMRNYLETLMFYSARARRFLACENILLRPKKNARAFVETTARTWFRPELIAYPQAPAEIPLELEAHRRLVGHLLGRAVGTNEVLPTLYATCEKPKDYWICAPVTDTPKVYPFSLWKEVFCALKPQSAHKKLLLVGSQDQRPQLEELQRLLENDGIAGARAHVPSDLLEFLNVIAGAELILTVDTAAAHIATALDRPCVVLFSGMHEGMFGPWRRSPKQQWILPEPPPGRAKFKWHEGISPGRAAAEVRKLVQYSPSALGAEVVHNSSSR